MKEKQKTDTISVKKTYENAQGKDKKKALYLLQKSRRGIQRVIFGRTFFILLMVVLQLAVIVWGALYLSQYLVYYLVAFWIAGMILTISVVNRRDNVAFQTAWIVLMSSLPIFGGLLYLFIQSQVGSRLIVKRQREIRERTKKYGRQKESVLEEVRDGSGTAALASYVENVIGLPISRLDDATYYPSGEEFFETLLQELESAEHFIFLEYFIIQEGEMWGQVLRILHEKVRQGVEVRVLYDGMCMFDKVPVSYAKEVNAIGIKCKVFAPLRPALTSRQNNRDHRKILIIDGRVAFTGGVNLADEYINKQERFGYWKDNAIRLKGNVVQSMTLLFLQMWNTDERQEDEYEQYLEVPQEWKDSWRERGLVPAVSGGGYALPYASSPNEGENIAENVYLDIINRAERYVHIMTPYLVLSQEMRNALCFAAQRGVEVIILMPHIPDKKYAFALAKTYYSELLDAGVQIYEFTEGFLHAKTFACDDVKAVVGSINMDFRSFYLHYECAVYLYQAPVIADIEDDMQKTMARSQKITREDVKKRKLGTKMMGAVMRLLAPLM